MDESFLPYGRQWIEEDDIAAVTEVLRGDWLTTGPAVERFESELALLGEAKSAVAVSSGTAALHAAYFAAGLGPGDEIIVPSLTFSASANAARQLGATVRFADIDKDTLTISPESVSALVNSKTKVITAVDYAGHPADYDSLRTIADDHGATLVADACHSIGGQYKERAVGNLADLSCFSFHPVKSVTTGEGGAVLSSNEELAERARRFRSHGIERGTLCGQEKPGAWAYDIQELGLNYRLTDMQCALGGSQLKKLGAWVTRRQEIAAFYRELLSDLVGLELPPAASWVSHAYHLFVIRVPRELRRRVFEALQAARLGVQVHYVPVNMLAAYQKLGYRPEETPVALKTYEQIMSIPCFPKMSNQEVERVATALRRAWRECGQA